MIKQTSPSIHNIINENKKACTEAQIKRLFQRVALPTFDLAEFHQSKLMTSSEHFVFFVQQLQGWNRKIIQQKNSPFSHSQFNRNSFIFSSLRSACTKTSSQVQQILKQLSKWFLKNSYNIPQPSILMKKYNQNQEWEVRKTFRSNSPSEINNYKRRFLCVGDDKQNNMLFGDNSDNVKEETMGCKTKASNNCQSKSKIKNGIKKCQNNEFQSFQQKQENDQKYLKCLLKKQNKKMFINRQDEQLSKAKQNFKVKKNRFSQSVSKRFYQGKFQTSTKQVYMNSRKSRNIRTVQTNRRRLEDQSTVLDIKKKRLNTSLGIRALQPIQQQHKRNNSQFQTNTQTNQQEKYSFLNNLIEQCRLKNQNKFLEVGGLNLISNPFIKKDKLKKQRKKK